MNRPPYIRPVTGVPSWALGLGIFGCVAGTYYYVLQKVGAADLNYQLEAEAARQDAAEGRTR